MKSFGLSLYQRIELKAILIRMGTNFSHYAQTKISAWRDGNGDVWVMLPGVYSGPVNFTGSLQWDI